jgi:NADPH2:quinone reductase
MKAIVVHEPGGAENLRYEEIARPEPGKGEVLVRIVAAGVNYIDTYFRRGMYPAPERPMRLGMEGSGYVETLGEGVTSFAVGDAVAFAMTRGAYAEYCVVAADKLVPVPAGVPVAEAAQMMLQGMTAHYLTRSTFALKPGDTCLVHAAAGGTGRLLCQIAKIIGARVIGTAGNETKAEQAKAAGADEVILYQTQDFVAEVKRITNGRGVDVVYDGVGATTFEGSLSSLRPRGMMVLFGQSSGPVPPFDIQVLNQKGSLFLSRPSLGHYVATREELEWRAKEIFEWRAAGKLAFALDRSYPLADAAQAHLDLEGRKTAGKLVLTVSQ